MPTTNDLDRLDILESRAAIGDLIHGYAHAFDHREPDALEALFHPDARVDLGSPDGEVSGHAAIMAVVAGLWDGMAETHHWISNVIPTIDGDKARSTCAVHAIVTTRQGERADVSGIYTDVFARRDGRWGFVDRRFATRYWLPIAEMG